MNLPHTPEAGTPTARAKRTYAERTSTNKDEVIAVNRQHPDWTAGDIADFLDCTAHYIYATARRYQLVIPRSPTVSGRLRRTERNLALMDLRFLRLAIDQGDEESSLVRRVDELIHRLTKQEA